MNYTAFDLAKSFEGLHELPGQPAEALIVAMLQAVEHDVISDEVAWCSAFVNFCAARFSAFGVPRSKSLAARSWLAIGQPVTVAEARVGWDVVVLQRGDGPQPGPEVTSGAAGHVGFFAGVDAASVFMLGGNQGDRVSVARFPLTRVLGVRRLRADA